MMMILNKFILSTFVQPRSTRILAVPLRLRAGKKELGSGNTTYSHQAVAAARR